jgi:hypothetical protein
MTARPWAVACAALLALGAASAAALDGRVEHVHHALHVTLDPVARRLLATDEITLRGGGTVAMTLGARFDVQEATLDGRRLPAPSRAQEQVRWSLDLGADGEHRVVLRYAGELAPLAETDHRGTLEGLPPMASARGSYLPAGTGWYAQIGDHLFTYRVLLELPAGQRGLVPGRLGDERDGAQGYRAAFHFPHPVEGIDLMAAPYVVHERMLERAGAAPIRLRTWFHAEVEALSDGYLDALERYLELYGDWLGAYPFTEFSVVSSPLPTGFGMPTLTYLGIDVLRLPFIESTSLGHEVLHNWWGNGVYVDYAGGNWAEGLTTFMADYAYKERESPEAARAMRLEWLRDFAAVPPGQDEPLRRFTARTHTASQIVGYHKAAFLFLMLRERLGTQTFDAGLRRLWREHAFKRAGWSDLQRAFEGVSGGRLDRFFEQWLARSGAPAIRIEQAQLLPDADGFAVRGVLSQGEPAYLLRVPLVLETIDGAEVHSLELSEARQAFALRSRARPSALLLDPQLRVFRRLDPVELPPILRQVLLDPDTVTVVPSENPAVRAAAQALAARLLERTPRLQSSIAQAEASLLLIATAQEIDAFLERNRLPARPPEVAAPEVATKGSAQVWAARQPNGKALAVIRADDAAALAALQRPLPHYGRQSWLVFQGARALERGVWPSQPLSWRFPP